MKKLPIILSILFLVLAFQFVSCDDIDSNSTTSTTNVSTTTSNNATPDDSSSSSYDKNWNRFQDFVVDNPYDIWLEAELNEGIEMPWYIYSNYIKFWIAEYESTLEYARDFFDNEENYISWKSNNEAWLEITRELYRNEVSNYDAQMERLEITIPYAKLIRQKVIDTKYFLYQLEINEKIMSGDFSDEYVALKWKGIETDN